MEYACLEKGGFKMKKKLDIFERRKLEIAKKTLKMNPVMVNIMGGMTIKEAKEIIRKYEKK